eukprot:m.278292 g.278292  ORF g.278292 m.278292 type:complete len:80 (-) comp59992_c0_seq1:6-245(-)
MQVAEDPVSILNPSVSVDSELIGVIRDSDIGRPQEENLSFSVSGMASKLSDKINFFVNLMMEITWLAQHVDDEKHSLFS